MREREGEEGGDSEVGGNGKGERDSEEEGMLIGS